MERKYSVYKIESPSGGCYVGMTGQSLKERWRQHVQRSYKHKTHPLYKAIREHGVVNMSVTLICTCLSIEEAYDKEIYHVSEIPADQCYNIAPGGKNDCGVGGRHFWATIKKDPEKLATYLKKLSEVKLSRDWTDYENLSVRAKKWRLENPKEAYRLSYRAIRLANKAQALTRTPPIKKELTRLEKLRWKYNRSEATHINTTKIWASRSEKEKSVIFNKISEKATERMAELSLEEKQEITRKARASIDRSKQGPAASKGIKKFWVELKKDPVKYREFMDAKTKTMMETNRKKNENL